MMADDTYAPDNKTQITIEFGSFIAFFMIATVIGFWIMGNAGMFTDNTLLLYWLLYVILNVVYIGFAGMFIFVKTLSDKLFVYLHNFDFSFIQNNGLFSIPKDNILYKIFKSFWLSLLLWHVLLSPLLLLQFALPRETAILLLPVGRQTVFPIVALLGYIFFNIFPASTGETGILAMLNSLLKTGTLKISKNNRKISTWIAIILIPLFSGFMWLSLHGFVAQGQELNQQAHFVFGVEQGLLMEMTGSVAPAIALHNLNLFYDGIQGYVGQYEFLRFAIPLTIILLWVGMILIYTRLQKKR